MGLWVFLWSFHQKCTLSMNTRYKGLAHTNIHLCTSIHRLPRGDLLQSLDPPFWPDRKYQKLPTTNDRNLPLILAVLAWVPLFGEKSKLPKIPKNFLPENSFPKWFWHWREETGRNRKEPEGKGRNRKEPEGSGRNFSGRIRKEFHPQNHPEVIFGNFGNRAKVAVGRNFW